MRAYNIGVLIALLLWLGGANETPSFLPDGFDYGALAGDLGRMLGGKAGLGTDKPQILYTKAREGRVGLRATARSTLVCAVAWHAARWGVSETKARKKRFPFMDKSRWDLWVRGCPKGMLERARKAGRANDQSNPKWALTIEKSKLEKLIALANAERDAESGV